MEVSEESEVSTAKLCRICLQLKDNIIRFTSIVSVPSKHDQILSLAHIFKTCTGLQVHVTDNLPQDVCISCVKKLFETYTFIEQSKTNTERLQTEYEKVLAEAKENEQCFEEDVENVVYTARAPAQDPAFFKSIRCDTAIGINAAGGRRRAPVRRKQTCHLCGKLCKNRVALTFHLAYHEAGGSPCSVCGKLFDDYYNYLEHYRRHQAVDESFACPECQKAFRFKAGLRRHLKKLHGVEMARPPRSYKKCNFCEYVPTSSQDRVEHEKSHMDERLYRCDICEKSYRSSTSLHKHKMSHVEVKPFQCTYCGQRFIRMDYLQKHLKPRTNLYCASMKARNEALTVVDPLGEESASSSDNGLAFETIFI